MCTVYNIYNTHQQHTLWLVFFFLGRVYLYKLLAMFVHVNFTWWRTEEIVNQLNTSDWKCVGYFFSHPIPQTRREKRKQMLKSAIEGWWLEEVFVWKNRKGNDLEMALGWLKSLFWICLRRKASLAVKLHLADKCQCRRHHLCLFSTVDVENLAIIPTWLLIIFLLFFLLPAACAENVFPGVESWGGLLYYSTKTKWLPNRITCFSFR